MSEENKAVVSETVSDPPTLDTSTPDATDRSSFLISLGSEELFKPP